jgi:hypothetical protein
MAYHSVPFPKLERMEDPITHRVISPVCWNGRHEPQEDYADRRVCQRSRCQCHCHHEEVWYKPCVLQP